MQQMTRSPLQPTRAASVQMESIREDKEQNLKKIEEFTREAAQAKAELVVFPECCITGYWFIRNLSLDQLRSLAEPVPNGPSTARIMALATRERITVGAGLVEREGNNFFNTYVVALPDGTVHRHR